MILCASALLIMRAENPGFNLLIIMEFSRCFLTRSSSRLRQKDVNEDEPEHTDAAVHEEGREGAEVVLERLEGLGDDEP